MFYGNDVLNTSLDSSFLSLFEFKLIFNRVLSSGKIIGEYTVFFFSNYVLSNAKMILFILYLFQHTNQITAFQQLFLFVRCNKHSMKNKMYWTLFGKKSSPNSEFQVFFFLLISLKLFSCDKTWFERTLLTYIMIPNTN